jgi:hypothetical protein
VANVKIRLIPFQIEGRENQEIFNLSNKAIYNTLYDHRKPGNHRVLIGYGGAGKTIREKEFHFTRFCTHQKSNNEKLISMNI